MKYGIEISMSKELRDRAHAAGFNISKFCRNALEEGIAKLEAPVSKRKP